ncbi:hypothetical protein GCM10010149_87820 [Nonomuraea roseoviolacea subsp. roseoviolacea]|uniref:hypothetical protein n=1 Tax=Nonomuraea roseoviolacea TaxID=103837 RepID=UPI0031DE3B87
MGWLIALGIVGGYLFVGFKFAVPVYMKRAMEDHVRRWPDLSRRTEDMECWRRSEAGFAAPIPFVWPLYFLSIGYQKLIMANAPLTDHEIRLQNKQLQERVAELEAEDRLWREMHR